MVAIIWFLLAIGCISLSLAASTFVYIHRERKGRVRNTWPIIGAIMLVGFFVFNYVVLYGLPAVYGLPKC